MADDAVKKAVGYGFDASLRKGTMAGMTAMRGSNEYQRLDSKGKDAADLMFRQRIEADSNLKQSKGIGDEKVSVYRKAAKEIPSRAIDYKKEFGPKVKAAAPKPATAPKPAAAPKPATAKKKSSFSRINIAKPSPSQEPQLKARKAPPTPAKPTPPAAPIRKAMGMPPAKQTPKTIGSGPSQMMAIPDFKLKKKQ